MKTPPPPEDENPLPRQGAGWASLLLSITVVMGGGFILAARVLPPLVGFDMDKQVAGIGEVAVMGVVFCVLLVFLMYLSVIVWLIVARLFVPRETMYAIMIYGPTSRFDHWLFNLLCPDHDAV
ncbi:MAG: hypothetical protein ACK4PK_11435 [Alphaproteobacteria bacterium]|jgi:hypothetical protein